MTPLYKAGLFLLTGYLLIGCAKPLAIDVPQSPAQIALASTVLDNQTVLLTVTRSISSLNNLNDGGEAQTPLGLANGTLISDATVLLSTSMHTDTLSMLYPGLYGLHSLMLTPYQRYQLSVRDKTSGATVTASTTYLPMVAVDTLVPHVTRTKTDTTVSLRLVMSDDPNRNDYYLMSYSTVNPASLYSSFGSVKFASLTANTNKSIELFTDADAIQGKIKRDFTFNYSDKDTLYVQIGRIEQEYFDYLTAYKRIGSVITQLTSEPITLPTNVIPGLGYFCLYETKRSAFVLKKY